MHVHYSGVKWKLVKQNRKEISEFDCRNKMTDFLLLTLHFLRMR
jgi:hypothetical protein